MHAMPSASNWEMMATVAGDIGSESFSASASTHAAAAAW